MRHIFHFHVRVIFCPMGGSQNVNHHLGIFAMLTMLGYIVGAIIVLFVDTDYQKPCIPFNIICKADNIVQ